MRVKLVSDNLLDNEAFELVNNNTPECWYTYVNGSVGGGSWVLTTPQTLHTKKIEFVDEKSTLFDYLKVQKSADVKGVGVYRNIAGLEHNLTNNYKTVTDFETTNYYNQDRVFQEGLGLSIKNIKSQMVLETNLLYTQDYQDNLDKELHIIQNEDSKELTSTTKYAPVRTFLNFQACLNEIKAIKTFFSTCLKYGRGFSVYLWVTPEDEEVWGTSPFASISWGGLAAEGEYSKPYHLDIASSNFVESSVTGTISIDAILQKRTMNYVS